MAAFLNNESLVRKFLLFECATYSRIHDDIQLVEKKTFLKLFYN